MYSVQNKINLPVNEFDHNIHVYALMYVYHVLTLQTYHTCVCFNVRLPCIDPQEHNIHMYTNELTSELIRS